MRAFRICSGFNPRPPFPGSDASAGPAGACRQLVSIHAPRFRGAMPALGPTSWRSPPSFNPRPPFPGSDARVNTARRVRLCVSIHAPRFRGAMHGAVIHESLKDEFQSTPPVSGERCQLRQWQDRARNDRFNPRPPFPGSDAVSEITKPVPEWVSIHAPRFRGAMRKRCPRGYWNRGRFNPRPPFPGSDAVVVPDALRALTRFNPRPPFPGSDALAPILEDQRLHVSIHAPRFRGAMRSSRRGCRAPADCFNPRPPFPGSDAVRRDDDHVAKAVSIHAPRFRGAMPRRRRRC